MAFHRLLFHTDNLETSIDTLNSIGYETTSSYLVIVVKNLEFPTTIGTFLRKISKKYYIFKTKEHFILILQNSLIKSFTVELISFNNQYYSNFDRTISFGIRDIATSLFTLHLSYERALFALKAAQQQHLNQLCFDDLGMFKLFFSIQDKKLLSDMYNNSLGILEDYDSTHKSNLTETLHLLY